MHRKNLVRRYEFISKAVGKNKNVLELGCGTCLLLEFLDRTNAYTGIELNQAFIDYAKSKRGAKVIRANIFDFRKYPKTDVIIMCDVLHHVHPRHEELLQRALRMAKKVIVCEPKSDYSMHNFLAQFDTDGINRKASPIGWNKEFRGKKLTEFLRKNGAKRVKVIGGDVIGVFSR